MQAYPNREMIDMYLGKDVEPRSYSLRQLFDSVKKRSFDVLVAVIVTLSILIWLFPLLALLIKLSSPGPVMYVQLRTGRNGKPFRCLKFRTMTYEQDASFRQATKNDIRVTRIGRLLRKSNVDEMPQFINVLLGHMSVVGPRPHPLPLDAQFWDTIPNYGDRYSVKPGITGLARARGARGETDSDHKMKLRVRYDHLYIRRRSTRLDAKICWWTVESAIKGNRNAW